MNILEKIRTKAQQAVQGIGNFIDRDKSMAGVQIAPGGIQGGVNRVKQAWQNDPQQFNVLRQMGQGNIKSGIKPLDMAGQGAGKTLDFATRFAGEAGQSIARNVPGLLQTGTKIAAPAFGVEREHIADEIPVSELFPNRPRAQSLANTLFGKDQTIRTVQGTQNLLEDEYGVAPPFALGLAVADPVTNIIPGGSGGKQVGKKVLKQGAKKIAKEAAEASTKEVVERVAKATLKSVDDVPLDKLFKSKSKAAKAAREQVGAMVKGADINPGNRFTNFFRDIHLDARRDLRRTFGGVYDKYIEPIYQAHTKRLADGDRWASTFHERLKGLSAVGKKTDDMLLHEFRTKGGLKRVAAVVGDERAKQLQKDYRQLRSMYDEIYETLKTNRGQAKGALKLDIPPKLEDFLSQMGSGKNKNMFSTILEGTVETTDPVSQAIFKKQKGTPTVGAIESMVNYLEYAKRAGFSDLTGADLKTIEKVLKKAGAPQEALQKLAQRSEEILGTSASDGFLKTAEQYAARMRRAAVLGKPTTLAAQFLSAPQATIEAGVTNVVKGMFSNEAAQAAKKSDLLTSTGYRIPKQLLNNNAFEGMVQGAGRALQSAQQATNTTFHKAFYSKARSQGKNADEALKYADDMITTVMGDRRLGMSPRAYNNLIGKIFGAFTIEPTAANMQVMRNLRDALKGNPDAAGKTIGTIIGFHLTNRLWERVTGFAPLPDLIDAGVDSLEYLTGSDEKEQSVTKAIARPFSEFLQMSPVVNNIFNTAYSAGEMAEILPDSRDVFGQDDSTWMNPLTLYNPLGNATREITGVPLIDVPTNVAANFIPFVEQGAKTAQAVRSNMRGAVEGRNDGGVYYETPKDPLGIIQSLVMGQYSTPEAQRYFDSDFNSPLDEKETDTYWNLPKGEARTNFLEASQASQRTKNKLGVGGEEKSGWLSGLFGGEAKADSGYSGIAPKTKEERKAVTDYVNTALEGGAIPDARDIKEGLFNGYTAESKSIEERMKVYSAIDKVMDNEYLTDEQKQAVIAASGASPENAEYYQLASKDQDVRLQEMLPILDNMDNKQMIEYLSQGRRAVGGKQLVSNGMIDYLYEMDYISEAEKGALKAIKYDEIQNKFYISKSYKGKGSISYKEALKLFKVDLPKFSTMKSVESLLSNYGGGMQQTNTQGETLLNDVLYKAPTKKNSGNSKLWF